MGRTFGVRTLLTVVLLAALFFIVVRKFSDAPRISCPPAL